MNKRRRFYKISPPRRHCPPKVVARLRWARKHPQAPLPLAVVERIIEAKGIDVRFGNDKRIYFVRNAALEWKQRNWNTL